MGGPDYSVCGENLHLGQLPDRQTSRRRKFRQGIPRQVYLVRQECGYQISRHESHQVPKTSKGEFSPGDQSALAARKLRGTTLALGDLRRRGVCAAGA